MENMNTILWIHLCTALIALFLTILQFVRIKGNGWHKALGKMWVLTLAITALSSFGIRELGGIFGFSWIHGLSIYTLVGLITAVSYARRGNIHQHRRNMLYISIALFIAGSFTLLPGRRLGDLLWS